MAYQNLGDSSISLPSDFNLVPKATAPHTTSRRVNVTPLSGGTFNCQDVAKFEIPCGIDGQYIDTTQTYLLFKVQNTDPAFFPFYPDHTAASFISKIEVYSSSQLVETINAYNVLYSALVDAQMGPMDRQGFLSITHGSDLDAAANTVNFSRGGQLMTYNNTYTFALPLISGIIGTNLNKMLPIGNLTDLRVEVTWESSSQAVLSATTTPVATNIWKITSAELVLQVLTLDREIHSQLINKDQIMISSESFRNYNTVLGNTNSDNIILPLKFTSAKSLLNCYRLTNNLNSYPLASITSRRNPFASSGSVTPSIFWLLGNVYAPSVPLRSVPEIYSEFAKSLHTLGNVNNKTVMNKNTYDQANEPQWGNTIANYSYSASMTLGSNLVSIYNNAVTAFTAANPSVITVTSTIGYEVGQPVYFVGTIPALGTVQWGGTTGSAPIAATSSTTIPPTIYYISAIASGTTLSIAANPYGFSQLGVGTAATGVTGLYIVQKDYYVQNTPSFLMGLNLDTMYQATNNSMSGINTNSGNVFLNTTYSAQTPSANNNSGQRFDCWCHYDFLIMIDPHTKQMTIRI